MLPDCRVNVMNSDGAHGDCDHNCEDDGSEVGTVKGIVKRVK